jgi:uncharacterized oligopeptide transporter (OPT) family protein
MYFGLQTGWVTMGSLQSTLLGFGIFRLLQRWLPDFGPLENVILQTSAVATGEQLLVQVERNQLQCLLLVALLA